MLQWIPLEHQSQVDEILKCSGQTPCIIYKHSNNCGVCSIAKLRLEDDWNFGPDEIKPYFLDVIQHRVISTIVAEQFLVYHESPQLLLIKNGECTYEATQLDISVPELRECLPD